jgi:polyisoprenoid-binding protein YceI
MRKGMIFAGALVLGALAALQRPSASRPEAESYTVDPVHSVTLFRILHGNVGAFHGRFNSTAGTFTVQEGGTGAVKIVIDAASVDTHNEGRNKHLKSADFFSVEQFPEIVFEGSLKHLSGNQYEAKGKLSLHGATKEVTVPMERIGSGEVPKMGYRTGFEGVFTIKRSDYGMNYGPGMLGDEVRVTVAVEGVRK